MSPLKLRTVPFVRYVWGLHYASVSNQQIDREDDEKAVAGMA